MVPGGSGKVKGEDGINQVNNEQGDNIEYELDQVAEPSGAIHQEKDIGDDGGADGEVDGPEDTGVGGGEKGNVPVGQAVKNEEENEVDDDGGDKAGLTRFLFGGFRFLFIRHTFQLSDEWF